MVDIQVRNLTKFFVIGENLLDDLSFEIQEGERVAILGRNGCGKTTLFNILTGQMDYDSGEVYVNPNKRLGLISQIPKFPAGYTVEDVLRTAYAGLMKLKARMERLEADMAGGATAEQLREYDSLSNRFQSGGGYEMDVDVDKVCNGLGIPAEQRAQEFDSLSGGEKTRANLAPPSAGKDGHPASGRADQPSGFEKRGVAGRVYSEFPGDGACHFPRPLFHRSDRPAGDRDRGRPRGILLRQLLVLHGRKAGAV